MKKIAYSLLLLFISFEGTAQIQVGTTTLDTVTLSKNLFIPWDLSWGPDNFIWFTERPGRVTRMDPETGQLFPVLSGIPDLWTDNPQPIENMTTGLFGMAIHPDFNTSPHVFLYYTYHPGIALVKIVRYTYDIAQDSLINPLTLIDNIPATTAFHNSGRMVISQDRKLIFTTGDRNEYAAPQNPASLNGKVLRMNLDGTVPSDNPVAGSYMWSIGIRHAQGLVFSPTRNILYSSQHGASTDDELNIIEPNRNYGWPAIEGFCNTPEEQSFCIANNVKEPLRTWSPTIAPCGIDFYNSTIIPEWQNSLLLTTLKERDLRVLNLSNDGLNIVNETIYFDYAQGMGRLRDVCVSPEGDVYVCTTNMDDNGIKSNPPPGIPAADDDRILRIANIAPRSLEVLSVSPTAIELVWKDRWIKETGFRLYRAQGLPENNYDLVATLPANTTNYSDASIIAGQTYYYRLLTYNASFTSGFSNTAIASVVLPVSLSGVQASVTTCNNVLITWQTKAEINNQGFYIEQSEDAVNYSVKDFVPAGNTGNYRYKTGSLANGKYYFRLKQQDYNGNNYYSETIAKTIDCYKTGLKIKPNPAKDVLYIEGLSTGADNTFTIYDAKGILQGHFSLTNGNSINISKLKPGLYFISNNGYAERIKFVKL